MKRKAHQQPLLCPGGGPGRRTIRDVSGRTE